MGIEAPAGGGIGVRGGAGAAHLGRHGGRTRLAHVLLPQEEVGTQVLQLHDSVIQQGKGARPHQGAGGMRGGGAGERRVWGGGTSCTITQGVQGPLNPVRGKVRTPITP
jgi:hypothetical protein